MPAWNNWYHCMANTYGTWLPGDPRGFRTRHHREHVEGDYKDPPPEGIYDKRHDAAKARLKRDPVILTEKQREIVLEEFRETLERNEVELLAICVCSKHVHVLGKFPVNDKKPAFSERGLRTSAKDDPVRHIMGKAKQWSAKRLIRDKEFDTGPIWGKRGKIVPIENRNHQVSTVRYIHKHIDEGAAVWTFRDEHRNPDTKKPS